MHVHLVADSRGFGAGHSLICGDRVQVWVLPVQWTDGSHLSDVKNVCVSIVHWCICQCVNFICAQFLLFFCFPLTICVPFAYVPLPGLPLICSDFFFSFF